MRLLGTILGIAITLAMHSCTDTGVAPSSQAAVVLSGAKLVLKTDSSSYTLVPGSGHTWTAMVYCSLTSTSQDTFFARLGDGFNASLDQDDLFVAEGSDGFIEKLEPDSEWVNRPRGIMIEGTRVVALRSSHKYRMAAYLRWQSLDAGVFRITVNYYCHIDSVGVASPWVEHSNTFSVL